MAIISISLLSGALWFISLFLPAFIFYDGVIWKGGEIFIQGWLGPLCFNFAWYANIFYFIALFKTLTKKKHAFPLSIISLLLSLNAFSYSTTDGYNLLYGYGLGFVLWNFSIQILFYSAGINYFKSNKSIITISVILLIPISIFITYFFYYSNNYVNYGNTFEKNFGNSHQVLFKKYEVCEVEISPPTHKYLLDGPLDIDNPGNLPPFDKPSLLLSWGIPKVRFGDYDYFLSIKNNKSTLVSKQKYGSVSATLVIRKTFDNNGEEKIIVKLISNDKRTIIFEQEWNSEVQEHIIRCPRFNYTYPEADEQPRKLLMESLAIDPLVVPPGPARPKETLSGIITSENEISRPIGLIPKNTNCLAGIGFMSDQEWYDLRRDNNALTKAGKPFKIKELYYFTKTRMNNSICANESIYPYYVIHSGENIYIEISKRDKNDFQEKWSFSAKINGLGEKIESKTPYVTSIEEFDRKVKFELLDSETSKTYTIESTIK